ncbi:MAG: dephospho-CoA kinase [Terriglobales bacterium]
MLKVGLTGGVACGKSTIGQMLVARGAHLIHADEIAHQLMRPGEPVYEEIVRHFGNAILQPDGSIDRQKLAEAAFGTGRVKELNAIVHPAVIAFQDRWMEETGSSDRNAVVVVEAALILEAGVQGRFDKIITVTCRPEQKTERFAARQKLPLEEARHEVERRSAAQLPDEEKARSADYVIDNSGDLASAEKQVDAVWEKLRRDAIR